MRFKKELSSPEIIKPILRQVENLAGEMRKDIRIMEVCGTHTVSLRKSGIHSLLPANIKLISGPGCPVCVTPTGYLDNALALVEDNRAVIATFGDMLKVPGSKGISLSRYLGTGRVRMVYSPTDLLNMALNNEKPVVFLGIGFETTIPTIASVFLKAEQEKIANLFLYTAFKVVIPALRALLDIPDRYIDGFLLPGHVSAIIGTEAYSLLEEPGGVPGVVAGFEPADMLFAILLILRQIFKGENRVENGYPRVVKADGNPRAREIMERLLTPGSEPWRGLGIIPEGSRRLKEEFRRLDADAVFNLPQIKDYDPPGCICAAVILGKKSPVDCSLFGKKCTPENPVGPCMVSSEGSCAAYLKYGE